MIATARNAPCPCGSGLRYKACHGMVPERAEADRHERLAAHMYAALEAQQSLRLDDAERHYRDALALSPDDADALHMLGMIRHERGDQAEATTLVLRALDLTGWRVPFMRGNLGVVLSRGHETEQEALRSALRDRYTAMLASRDATLTAARPLVSIVVPSYNHEAFIGAAIASVDTQDYRDIEVVVVDDGSTDRSPAAIEAALRGSPFPHRVVVRGNRGAAATLNDGAALATGEYLQFLNSDDMLAPSRVTRMVDAVARTGAQWGFSGVSVHDDAGAAADPMADFRAYDLMCMSSSVTWRPTVGLGLLGGNPMVSSGNLFVSRAFFERLGGFRDYRYNHDWDFALRALKEVEPAFVDEPLYGYRLHGANTIREAPGAPREEADGVVAQYVAWALSEPAPANAFAPATATWGPLFANAVLGGGIASTIDPRVLRDIALDRAKAIDDAR